MGAQTLEERRNYRANDVADRSKNQETLKELIAGTLSVHESGVIPEKEIDDPHYDEN